MSQHRYSHHPPASSLTSPRLNSVLAKMPKPTRRQSHSTPPTSYSRRVNNPRRSSHRSASPRRQRRPVKQTRFRVPSDDSYDAYGAPRDKYYLPGDDSDADHVLSRGRTPHRSRAGTAHSPPPRSSSPSSRSASSKTRYPRGHSPPSVSSRSSPPPHSPRFMAGRGRSADSHHDRREATQSHRARSHDPRKGRDRERDRTRDTDRDRDRGRDRGRDRNSDRDRSTNRAGSKPRDRDTNSAGSRPRSRDRDRDEERDSVRSRRRKHSPYPRKGIHHARSPSPSRSRSRSGSRSRSRTKTKPPSTRTIVREATHHALEAGALAALSLRHDPSPWLGKKGGQVAAAAIGAAVVDTFVSQRAPKRQGGLRHSVAKKAAQMVVGGLAVSAASAGGEKVNRAKGRR